MIKAIKLNNCTPYVCSELSNCNKINFIFGANGSGKSTISAFLAGATDTRYVSSSIEWFSENHETIYVYNKRFRNDNFKETIPGVFTLGSATIEDIEELEILKEKHNKLLEEIAKLSEALKKKDNEISERELKYTEDIWLQILKQYERTFQKAFEGFRGKKDKFRRELERRINEKLGIVCQIDDLKVRAKTLYSGKLIKCERIILDSDDICNKINAIISNPIWDVSIIGNDDVDIASLINKLGNSSWVSQGLKYISDNSNVCPFCQNETITDVFRKKIEDFFDEEYSKKISEIKTLRNEYFILGNQLKTIIDSAVSYDDAEFLRISGINVEDFQNKLKLLQNAIGKDLSEIDKKIDKPETRILVSGIQEDIDRILDVISKANELIDSHNLLVENQKNEEIALTNDIWATCIDLNKALIGQFNKDRINHVKARDGINRLRNEKKEKAAEQEKTIIEKGKNITSVQPTVDEINRLLKAYGFDGFSIQKVNGEENYYTIKRNDGTPAQGTLSEGEETFLTFLYFMQMTKGSSDPDHVSDQRIIVLDDPISSLDSTILYIVGAMVKDLSETVRNDSGNVKQLFVLTHNVFFHKEASFINGRSKECKDVSYWIVRKDEGVSTIKPYGMKNPISTSYELLWKELREGDLSSLITIQNTMRRIIENYFGIIGSRLDDKLVDCFDSVEEKTIARSLLYWINDGSHSIPDDLFIDSFSDAVPKYKKVFKELFIKSGHEAHYNMMMGESCSQIENDSESTD